MSRFQRVRNELWMTGLIAAVIQWIVHPEQGWIMAEYILRVAMTVVIVYVLKWLFDTFELRRRQ